MLEKIIDWLKKNSDLDRTDLTLGLAWGLALGLAGGLGSIVGLSTLVFFQDSTVAMIPGLIVLLILTTEIIFWLDKKQPKKKESRMIFTLKRKSIAIFKASFLITQIGGIFALGRRAIPYLKDNLPTIIKWLGYIGIGLIALAVIVGIIYLWIHLNSLKYRER